MCAAKPAAFPENYIKTTTTGAGCNEAGGGGEVAPDACLSLLVSFGAGGHAALIFVLMELIGAGGFAVGVLQECESGERARWAQMEQAEQRGMRRDGDDWRVDLDAPRGADGNCRPRTGEHHRHPRRS